MQYSCALPHKVCVVGFGGRGGDEQVFSTFESFPNFRITKCTMRKLTTLSFLLLLLFSTSACYHAEVVTGRPASDQVVEEEWVLGFVYGLVVPNEIDVEEECAYGVARVETKLSFLNQVASFITGGLFTPMHVTVTCASSFDSVNADNIMEDDDPQAALQKAAVKSFVEDAPVYVGSVNQKVVDGIK